MDVAGAERVGLAEAIAHDLQRLGDLRTVVRMPGQPCCGAQVNLPSLGRCSARHLVRVLRDVARADDAVPRQPVPVAGLQGQLADG
ncbi:hypothetical protein CCO03_01215 [Comamonas serinivorans]|uniref:Uncharacterized protein n=1 Tax=Comamonas serinivorans TaxID=1082851 RepID=A0A1Y0EIN6_9BURK|nr:hypothetical protein CCO03_01215 [Comamonas serinivorans]